MKNYTYQGAQMSTFTIGEKDYILSKGATTSLPEDHELVKDMVAKKLLVEVPKEKPGKNPDEKK